MHEAKSGPDRVDGNPAILPGQVIRCGSLYVSRSLGGNRLIVTPEDYDDLPDEICERLAIYGFVNLKVRGNCANKRRILMRWRPLRALHCRRTEREVKAIIKCLFAEFAALEQKS